MIEAGKSTFEIRGDDAKLRLLAAVLRDSNDAITVQDLEGKILVWNRGAEKMYGYSEADALNMNIDAMVPEDKKHETWTLIDELKRGNHVDSAETRRLSKDGRILDVWLTVTKLVDENGNVAAVATTERDVTGQKKTTEALKKALHEKELLIREIHHRVKNNLLGIQSLLRLPLKRIRDEEAREYFRESVNRVTSMSMIHERLYRTHDLSSINIAEYMYSLGRMLLDFYRIGEDRIKFDFSIPDMPLDVEKMIPCGLIVNELITNALKYAFPDDREGKIRIEFRKISGKEYVLLVGDDGIGLPEDLDIHHTESLGMQLVTSLVKQLNGTLEVSGNNGTEFRIRFCDEQ